MCLRLLPLNLGLYTTSVFDPCSPLTSGSQKSALTGFFFSFFVFFFSVLFCVLKSNLFFFGANFVPAVAPNRSSLNSHGSPWSCTSCGSQLKIVIARSPSNTWGQNMWLIVSVRCALLPLLRVDCCVTLGQLRRQTTSCLQLHEQRSDVQQPGKSERFVWIDGSVPLRKNSWIIFRGMDFE